MLDIYYFQEMRNDYQDGERSISRSDVDILVDLYNRLLNRGELATVHEENEVKSREMKRYMFGKVRSMFGILLSLCLSFLCIKYFDVE